MGKTRSQHSYTIKIKNKFTILNFKLVVWFSNKPGFGFKFESLLVSSAEYLFLIQVCW